MEEQNTHPDVKEDNLCANCKSQEYSKEHPNRFCLDCREQFIKYQIPSWIWLFAGFIGITMIIGTFRMPAYLSSAIKLRRAEKAIEAKQYVTAQRELESVVKVLPNNITANGNLFVASAYNWDWTTLREAYRKLENKHVEDNALLDQVNEAMIYVEQGVPADTTLGYKIAQIKNQPEELNKLFSHLDSTQDKDLGYGGVLISNNLYELKEYNDCERILEKILSIDKNNYGALSLLAPVKRNKGDFDAAISLCKRALSVNSEDVAVLAQMARIELKRKKDATAAVYAKEAMKINRDNIYALEAQAMVDFFYNKKTAAILLLEEIKKKEAAISDNTISTRLAAIINGKENYR